MWLVRKWYINLEGENSIPHPSPKKSLIKL